MLYGSLQYKYSFYYYKGNRAQVARVLGARTHPLLKNALFRCSEMHFPTFSEERFRKSIHRKTVFSLFAVNLWGGQISLCLYAREDKLFPVTVLWREIFILLHTTTTILSSASLHKVRHQGESVFLDKT